MKLYIATRRQENGRMVRDAIIASGHECTATWLNEEGYGVVSKTPEQRADIAAKDLDDISASDGLIVVSEPDGARVAGGKHVEAGFALGRGLPVFLLGAPENIFHEHRAVVRCDSIEHLLELLPQT